MSSSTLPLATLKCRVRLVAGTWPPLFSWRIRIIRHYSSLRRVQRRTLASGTYPNALLPSTALALRAPPPVTVAFATPLPARSQHTPSPLPGRAVRNTVGCWAARARSRWVFRALSKPSCGGGRPSWLLGGIASTPAWAQLASEINKRYIGRLVLALVRRIRGSRGYAPPPPSRSFARFCLARFRAPSPPARWCRPLRRTRPLHSTDGGAAGRRGAAG